jgi:Glycosyl transferase family 2
MIALLSLCAWIYLFFAHGEFWRSRPQLSPAAPKESPDVDIIVPARDEAETIHAAIGSLLAQDYGGKFRVILVDDNSTDGTASLAGAAPNLQIIRLDSKPPGWSGKLWALHEGIAASRSPIVLLTDADIVHQPAHLATLVAKLLDSQLDLVSEMVRLNCTSLAERMLVPAFVYFFQMLYPFAKVNDPRSRVAAAAGGTILVRREALARNGGIDAIKDALIDDVALAKAVKQDGPIFLGHSQLAYDFADRVQPVALFGVVAIADDCLAQRCMARAALGSSLWPRLGFWLWPCCLPACRSELYSHTDEISAQSAVGLCATADCAVLHGRNQRLGGELLARQRRELEESGLPALAPCGGAGHRARHRLQRLAFDRKVVDVHLVRHAVGAIVQIAQAEVLRENVFQLINEFAIAVAHKIRVCRAHEHRHPASLNDIVALGIGTGREGIEIDVDDGVVARNAGAVRTSAGADGCILACAEVQQKCTNIVFQSVAAVERRDPVIRKVGMVMFPGARNSRPTSRCIGRHTDHDPRGQETGERYRDQNSFAALHGIILIADQQLDPRVQAYQFACLTAIDLGKDCRFTELACQTTDRAAVARSQLRGLSFWRPSAPCSHRQR